MTQIEIELCGFPFIFLATDKTIAWKMKEPIDGDRFGQWYECKEGLSEGVIKFLRTQAEQVIYKIALDNHGA